MPYVVITPTAASNSHLDFLPLTCGLSLFHGPLVQFCRGRVKCRDFRLSTPAVSNWGFWLPGLFPSLPTKNPQEPRFRDHHAERLKWSTNYCMSACNSVAILLVCMNEFHFCRASHFFLWGEITAPCCHHHLKLRWGTDQPRRWFVKLSVTNKQAYAGSQQALQRGKLREVCNAPVSWFQLSKHSKKQVAAALIGPKDDRAVCWTWDSPPHLFPKLQGSTQCCAGRMLCVCWKEGGRNGSVWQEPGLRQNPRVCGMRLEKRFKTSFCLPLRCPVLHPVRSSSALGWYWLLARAVNRHP